MKSEGAYSPWLLEESVLMDGGNGVGINDFGGGSRGISLLCGADIDINGVVIPDSARLLLECFIDVLPGSWIYRVVLYNLLYSSRD